MAIKKRKRMLRWVILVPIALGCLYGCSTIRFYQQAISGQAEIMAKQRPIEELLSTGEVDEKRARKLRLVLEVRDFAEEHLSLPAGKNYTRFADLERDHVVWTVFAAPEFSLEPKTWRYPVVGELDYRGYFSKAQAQKCGDQLRAKGYDVFMGGVDAYSTLGWFNDPVLNTFIDYNDADLAELILHELVHRRVYRSGETAFNEALATAVAQVGVIRFLGTKNDSNALASYREQVRRIDEIYHDIALTRTALESLYEESIPQELMREQKREILMLFQERLAIRFADWGNRKPDSWLKELPNNARLNASATYYEYVPAFKTYLTKKCEGNLGKFLEEMKAISVEEFVEHVE